MKILIRANIIFTIISALSLFGCATKLEDIPASYVSPLTYDAYSCKQIAEEAERISTRATEVTGAQRKKAKSDAVAVGVAVVLFWPAVFFVKGGSATEAEVARIKGEMNAIRSASIRKKCNLNFNTSDA